MWGRMASCAAVDYRRCTGGPIDNRPQLNKLPHIYAVTPAFLYQGFAV